MPPVTKRRNDRNLTVLVASDWAPIRAFDGPMRTTPESVYGDLLPELRAADLRIVNCECALTRARKPVWKSGTVFKGEPAHAGALTAVPFEVACLANNHVLDYGVPGLRETLNVLERHGIMTVGAGLTDEEAHRPLSVTVGGARVHVVNVSEGEDLTASEGGPGVFGWDIARACVSVADCRRRGGFVIAIVHCGLEYIPSPPPYVATACRALIDAGADCVVGHHPHVAQGIESHQGRPIVYSLGNFAFYQPTDLYWRRTGFCVRLHYDGTRVSDVDLVPYRISETGLRALATREEAEFGRMMTRLSSLVDGTESVDAAWQAYLAYYGVSGFATEVRMILDRLASEPAKGAAMFRNRITTMQHRELWRDLLTRVTDGERSHHSRAAYRLIDEWFTRKLP